MNSKSFRVFQDITQEKGELHNQLYWTLVREGEGSGVEIMCGLWSWAEKSSVAQDRDGRRELISRHIARTREMGRARFALCTISPKSSSFRRHDNRWNAQLDVQLHYSSKWRWIVVDICLTATEARQIPTTLHRHWGEKLFKYIPNQWLANTKLFNFFFWETMEHSRAKSRKMLGSK